MQEKGKKALECYNIRVKQIREDVKTIEFEQLLDAVADGITVQDTTGKVVCANNAAAKIIGFSSAKALIKTPPHKILDKFVLTDISGKPFPIENLPGRVALGGKESERVIIGFRKKGSKEVRWSVLQARPIFDKDGNIQWAVNLFHEVTDLQKTTETLLFQNALLEAENSASQDGKLIISEKGRTLSFNKKYLEIWDITSDQIRDKTERQRLNLLKHKVKRPKKFMAYVQQINANPKKSSYDEVELLDGRWIERYTTPLTGPHREHYGRIWFARDITERKKEARRSEIFLSVASHELKTPLASIKAYLHLIESEIKGNKMPIISQYVEKIDTQTTHLHRLIKTLLDLTTIRANRLELNKEVFDFDEFISSEIKDLQLVTKHKIILKGSAKTSIVADRVRLNEVFSNLIKNAVKYSPDSNKVIVKVLSSKSNIIVHAKDFGLGIPQKNLSRIFELFYRESTNEGITGFGVGLYISNEIIKRHRGTISVISKKDKGSTFTVELPLYVE
jgi:signal transduction histidine kinase